MSETYNDRLFAGGLRRRFHLARFLWLQSAIRRHRLACRRVVELGCFDGKLVDWLPAFPDRYLGVDANWEGGLDLARARFADDPRVTLIEATHPAEIAPAGEPFDLGVAMETLEHLPDALLDPYLARMAEIIRGHLLVTVPNELGLVFAAKWAFKRLRYGDAERYTPTELVSQILGQPWPVAHQDHKGFSYRTCVAAIARHFRIVAVESIPLRHAPHGLSFQIGVVAQSRL